MVSFGLLVFCFATDYFSIDGAYEAWPKRTVMYRWHLYWHRCGSSGISVITFSEFYVDEQLLWPNCSSRLVAVMMIALIDCVFYLGR